MPFEQWAKNILNRHDIELLNKALGKQDVDKVVRFIYDEKISGNSVQEFAMRIYNEYELDKYYCRVYSYLDCRFFWQAAMNKGFVNAVAEKVQSIRDEQEFTLTQDIEKAIYMIAFPTADDDEYPQEFINIARNIWKLI